MTKKQAARALRGVEAGLKAERTAEGHKRKEVEKRKEKRDRTHAAHDLREVGPGVFLDNETESKAKRTVEGRERNEADPMNEGEAMSDRHTAEDKKVMTIGAVILCRRRGQRPVHL